MKEKLTQRLQTLKAEFEAGQKLLADYETKQLSLRETLLRISGAIQVLEEVLSAPDSEVTEEIPTDELPAEPIALGEGT
jgi:predicted nuclease with TOPRIM domain